MESFSQYGEDRIVAKILAEHGITTGRCLELGAWDPVDKSNSRALILAGWSAVLLEPSPAPLKNLVHAYADNPRVEVVGAAVTVGGGLLRIEVTDDAVSQPSGEHIEAWRATGGFYGKLCVPSISVADLFTAFGGNFEVVSIDVEGASVDVFAEMLRVGPRPRVVLLEHDSRYVEIAQYAEKAHYQQVHLNGTNVILEWKGKREW